MMGITITDHSVSLWGLDRFNLLGVEVGWYGIAGLMALLSGPSIPRWHEIRAQLGKRQFFSPLRLGFR